MEHNIILFLIIIFLANIIQGITGFAGTVLAMPFGIRLVGYEVAKPILNILGIFSGIYVFAGNRKSINRKELVKIVAIMALGIFSGIYIKALFVGKEQILYRLLGLFIIMLALHGLYKTFREQEEKKVSRLGVLLLPIAGIVHGIFVSGGPLLISYLTTRIKDKTSFRATISTVWIFLNTLIMVDDIRSGYWTKDLVETQLWSIPFLFAGMFIGSYLVKRMSQKKFMKITYVLLVISGVSLLAK